MTVHVSLEQQQQDQDKLGWLAYMHGTHVEVQQLHKKMDTLSMNLKVIQETLDEIRQLCVLCSDRPSVSYCSSEEEDVKSVETESGGIFGLELGTSRFTGRFSTIKMLD